MMKPPVTVPRCLLTLCALFILFTLSACSNPVDGGGDSGPSFDAGVCTVTETCPWGYYCRKGLCVPEPSCKSKLDCRVGEECEGGKCRREIADAGDQDGAADADLPDAGYCMNDDECGYGDRCNKSIHRCEEAAIIQAEPARADFGSVQWNQTVTLGIVITNTGKKPLDVLGTSFESGTSPQFRIVSGGAPFTLTQDQHQTVLLSYTQTGAVVETGALLVTSTDPERSLVRIPVFTSYKGTPYFSIVDRTQNPPLKLYPTRQVSYEYAFDMGTTNLTTPISRTMTIMNMTPGDAILEIQSVSLEKTTDGLYTYKFMTTGNPPAEIKLPLYLAASGMADMVITYTPDAKSTKKFEVKDAIIKTNDNDISHTGNPGNDSLTAHMSVGLGSSKISLSKTVITFPDTIAGKSSQDTVRVTNDGQSALFFKPGTGLETADGAYSLNPSTFTIPLLPTEFIDVKATFAPPDIKIYQNNIVFNTDDPSTPTVKVALAGKGISPTGAPCEYDNDCLGGNVCRQNRCCTTDCDGICASCALDGHLGYCTPLPDTTECLAKYCEGRYVHKTKMCSGKEPATCDDKGVIDCFPMNCRTAPDISCPDSTSCSNQGPCAAGAACCGGNCSDISSYINSCTTATQLQAKPGEAKCGTLICCMEGATFELSETQKGNRSAWYHGKATWSSGCPCNFCLIGKCDEYIVNHHQIVFTAPAGAYYKVRLYFGNPGYNGCNEKPITEIPVGNGEKSTMYVSRNVYMSDSDKSMDYWIEIVYDHGATCGQWQLDTYWSNCKY